jgi:hypothetical protein
MELTEVPGAAFKKRIFPIMSSELLFELKIT